MTIFTGAATAIVTPFHAEGEVNYDKFGELIDWQIESGIDALIVCGTTGEEATLSDPEHKSVIEFAVKKVNKRVPLIVGAGSNDTMYALQLALHAEHAGVDGLLMVTPYYNKSTQKNIVRHYTYLADRLHTPIILYNVPGRTGFHIGAGAVAELSQHPNIVALKEASGDISYVADVASRVSEDFAIYSGNDDMIVPVLSLGGKGVISVLSNIFPKETHEMVMHYLNGNVNASREIQLRMYGFVKALFLETNPIPVKTCMNLLGCNVGTCRMPLGDMEESTKAALIREMIKVGLAPVNS